MEPFFSIIVVSLNPGAGLELTLESIFSQSFGNYQVVLKDAVSTDGSVEAAQARYGRDARLLVERRRDGSIYQGMNQALALAVGQYWIFLNCGDCFYSREVLELAARKLEKSGGPGVLAYGDTFIRSAGVLSKARPVLGDFGLYRGLPCHQSCIYHRDLFGQRGYAEEFAVRGDYEHFLWAHYVYKARLLYLDMAVSSYEGGGFSESAGNWERDKREHEQITAMYMPAWKTRCFGLLLALSLPGLRRRLFSKGPLARCYAGLKGLWYGLGRKREAE